MNHARIAHCPGISQPVAAMLGVSENMCKSCIRYAAHTDAVELGIRTKVQYITPRLNNGCSHYKEVDYVDFELIVNSSTTTCHFTQRNSIQ